MLDLPDDLMMLLCTKPKDARIHVDFLGGLQPERLQQRISPTGSWTHVVAFRPTGTSLSQLIFLAKCQTLVEHTHTEATFHISPVDEADALPFQATTDVS